MITWKIGPAIALSNTCKQKGTSEDEHAKVSMKDMEQKHGLKKFEAAHAESQHFGSANSVRINHRCYGGDDAWPPLSSSFKNSRSVFLAST